MGIFDFFKRKMGKATREVHSHSYDTTLKDNLCKKGDTLLKETLSREKGEISAENRHYYEEALSYFEQALEIDPNDISIYHSKSLALFILRRNEEALACINQGLQIAFPDNIIWLTTLWVLKGSILGALGRREDADISFKLGDRRTLDEESQKQKTTEMLVTELKDWRIEVRLLSIISLSKIKDIQTVEPLMSALKDESEWVREAAEIVLKKMDPKVLKSEGTSKLIPMLVAELKDWRIEVRKIAASLLGKIGSKQTFEPLISVLDDKNDDVRKAVQEAMDCIGITTKEKSMPDAPLQKTLTLWSKDEETAHNMVTDQYYLFGVIMASDDSKAKMFFNAMSKYGYTYEVWKNRIKGGFDVILSLKMAKEEEIRGEGNIDQEPTCAHCSRTESRIERDLAEAKKRGLYIFNEGDPVLLYCYTCKMFFCGRCQIDLGMNSGCPRCKRALN